MIRTLVLLSAVLVSACVAQPEYPAESRERPLEKAPRSVRAQPVSLGDWQVPEQLDAYLLQGSMVSADGQARMLQYAAGERELRIALYPLPGGWDSFDPERAVAGHFAQIQQQELDRMQREGSQATRISKEALLKPRSGWPVARVLLTGHFPDGREQSRLIMLTGNRRVFVRAFHEPTADVGVAEVHDLLQRFMAGLKPPTSPSAP